MLKNRTWYTNRSHYVRMGFNKTAADDVIWLFMCSHLTFHKD